MADMISMRAKAFSRRPDVAVALADVVRVLTGRADAAARAASSIGAADAKRKAAKLQHQEAVVFQKAGETQKADALDDKAQMMKLEAEEMMEQAERELVLGEDDDVGGVDQARPWGDGGVGPDSVARPPPAQELATELAAAAKLERQATKATKATAAKAFRDAAATVRRVYAQARLQAAVANWLEPMPL